LPEKAYSVKKAKTILEVRGLKLIPIVDTNKKVVNFISQSSLLSINVPAKNVKRIDMAVIIMAGGKSTRLEPFSKIFPKPLIPIGDKPIIDRIIDEFRKNGINRYYLTLNYKGDMIESYFNHMKKDYHVSFLREKGYYGTAGSLKLFHKYTDDTFIVSNCDVIIKADFEDVIKFHNKQESDLTILSSMQHYKIPYGVINFKKGGEVINLTEKPEYTFAVNAGVYILRRKILRFIPSHKRFDMTDLIKVLIDSRKRVFTYPVNENEYIDIGQWDEYKKAMGKIL
jgi:NDP-sugar pyrophosphorylase family protein